MYTVNDLVNRRIKNLEEDIIYRIVVVENVYKESEYHDGESYIRVKKLSEKGKKRNYPPNIIHVNKKDYKNYVILDKLYSNIDEDATRFLHSITCNLD